MTLTRLRQRWISLQFTHKQQQAFLEDLHSLVKDGVSVTQAIETIRTISTHATQKIATRIAEHIAQGKLLADGMQGFFSRAIIEIIRAGENSGTLDSTLESATQTFSQRSSAITSLIHAILYPLTVVCLALGVTVFIKNSVLNSFAKIKPITQWSSMGQSLFYLAEITQDGWWLILLIILGIIFLIAKMLRHYTHDSRHTIDTLPLFSLYRNVVAARLMETLGLLMRNGVILKKALQILQLDASPYLSWHLLMMELRLSGGTDNIADVLDTQLIQKNDLVRLRVVAKGKGFERALISLGRQANERNGKTIALMGKICGALLLALGAFIAATLIFGIYTVGSTIAQ